MSYCLCLCSFLPSPVVAAPSPGAAGKEFDLQDAVRELTARVDPEMFSEQNACTNRNTYAQLFF